MQSGALRADILMIRVLYERFIELKRKARTAEDQMKPKEEGGISDGAYLMTSDFSWSL